MCLCIYYVHLNRRAHTTHPGCMIFIIHGNSLDNEKLVRPNSGYGFLPSPWLPFHHRPTVIIYLVRGFLTSILPPSPSHHDKYIIIIWGYAGNGNFSYLPIKTSVIRNDISNINKYLNFVHVWCLSCAWHTKLHCVYLIWYN